MKFKQFLTERYSWDINRQSASSAGKGFRNTNPTTKGRDWSDKALRDEDEKYGDQTKARVRPSAGKWELALNIPFADKDEAKQEFKRYAITLRWDANIENPVTNKKGTWVGMGDRHTNLVGWEHDPKIVKWFKDRKTIPQS